LVASAGRFVGCCGSRRSSGWPFWREHVWTPRSRHRHDDEPLAMRPRGHFLLGDGLRLEGRDIVPSRIFVGSRAAIDVPVLDLQKGLLAQLGEIFAALGLHPRRSQLFLDIVLYFLEGSLPRLVALLDFENHESTRRPNGIGYVTLLVFEHHVFN